MTILKTTLKAAASAIAVLSLTATAAHAEHHAKSEHKTSAKASADIVDTAVAAGNFETLVAAVKAAGLVETLKSDGPFTVFAPTDEAFAKLPKGTVEALLLPENKDQLTAILTYHVVPQKAPASALAGKTGSVETVEGGAVNFDGTNGVTVNGANVVKADIMTSNGIIHVIDTVLMPPKTM